MNQLNSVRTFNCDKCKITFSSERQYSVHQALAHNERCKYECICGKDYMLKKDLKRHQRRCTARGNYRCSKCESILSDIHNGRMHEAVCQTTVDRHNGIAEPTRNELLALRPKEDNIAPYETAFEGRLASYFIRSPCCMDLSQFLNNIKSKAHRIIKKHVKLYSSIKVNLWVDCTFKNMQGEEMSKALKTSNEPIYMETDMDEYLSEAFSRLKREMEQAVMSKSGWKLISVDGLRVRIGKYPALIISSYIPLPKNIQAKKACINVKNYNDKCFIYTILAKFVKKNAHVPNRYEKILLKNKYNFKCIQYPTELKSIPIFERTNNITINIFGLDE
ncbi:uncharacterized protein [Rhodnius prolixus]|uniref:uncharacterized protein n=1 Tax=Rhodnius prolixus TaxID=13249 RepID=UPI003D18B23C